MSETIGEQPIKEATVVVLDTEKLKGAFEHGAIKKLGASTKLSLRSISNKLSGKSKITTNDLNLFANFINRDPSEFLVKKKIAWDVFTEEYGLEVN